MAQNNSAGVPHGQPDLSGGGARAQPDQKAEDCSADTGGRCIMWLAIGVGLGIAIGTALGQIGIGVAIGAGVGVTMMVATKPRAAYAQEQG